MPSHGFLRCARNDEFLGGRRQPDDHRRLHQNPAEVIDKTDYKAWLVPVDQRACPQWSEVAR
jgi:hypothetical protein